MVSTTKSKRVLITGSGSGIGARCGSRVWPTAGTACTLQLTRKLKPRGGDRLAAPASRAFKLEITDETDRARVTDLPIDALVNNAALGESGSLAEVPLERVRATFETNLFATLALTQLVLRGMIARRSGTIIFISSLAGRSLRRSSCRMR